MGKGLTWYYHVGTRLIAVRAADRPLESNAKYYSGVPSNVVAHEPTPILVNTSRTHALIVPRPENELAAVLSVSPPGAADVPDSSIGAALAATRYPLMLYTTYPEYVSPDGTAAVYKEPSLAGLASYTQAPAAAYRIEEDGTCNIGAPSPPIDYMAPLAAGSIRAGRMTYNRAYWVVRAGGVVYIRDLTTGQYTPTECPVNYADYAVSPDLTRIYTASSSSVYAFSSTDNFLTVTLSLSLSYLERLIVSPSGDRLFGIKSSTLYVIDTATLQITSTVSGAGDITIAPNGTFLILGSNAWGGSARVYLVNDLTTPIATIPMHSKYANNRAAISPDSSTIAYIGGYPDSSSAVTELRVKIYSVVGDPISGVTLHSELSSTLHAEGGHSVVATIGAVAFINNTRLLLAAGADNSSQYDKGFEVIDITAGAPAPIGAPVPSVSYARNIAVYNDAAFIVGNPASYEGYPTIVTATEYPALPGWVGSSVDCVTDGQSVWGARGTTVYKHDVWVDPPTCTVVHDFGEPISGLAVNGDGRLAVLINGVVHTVSAAGQVAYATASEGEITRVHTALGDNFYIEQNSYIERVSSAEVITKTAVTNPSAHRISRYEKVAWELSGEPVFWAPRGGLYTSPAFRSGPQAMWSESTLIAGGRAWAETTRGVYFTAGPRPVFGLDDFGGYLFKNAKAVSDNGDYVLSFVSNKVRVVDVYTGEAVWADSQYTGYGVDYYKFVGDAKVVWEAQFTYQTYTTVIVDLVAQTRTTVPGRLRFLSELPEERWLMYGGTIIYVVDLVTGELTQVTDIANAITNAYTHITIGGGYYKNDQLTIGVFTSNADSSGGIIRYDLPVWGREDSPAPQFIAHEQNYAHRVGQFGASARQGVVFVGDLLVVIDAYYGAISVTDPDSGSVDFYPLGITGKLCASAVTNKHTNIVWFNADGWYTFDIQTQVVQSVNSPLTQLSHIEFDPQGRYVICYQPGSTNLVIYDATSLAPIVVSGLSITGNISLVSVSNDGDYILIGETPSQNRVIVVDVTTYGVVFTVNTSRGVYSGCVFSYGGVPHILIQPDSVSSPVQLYEVGVAPPVREVNAGFSMGRMEYDDATNTVIGMCTSSVIIQKAVIPNLEIQISDERLILDGTEIAPRSSASITTTWSLAALSASRRWAATGVGATNYKRQITTLWDVEAFKRVDTRPGGSVSVYAGVPVFAKGFVVGEDTPVRWVSNSVTYTGSVTVACMDNQLYVGVDSSDLTGLVVDGTSAALNPDARIAGGRVLFIDPDAEYYEADTAGFNYATPFKFWDSDGRTGTVIGRIIRPGPPPEWIVMQPVVENLTPPMIVHRFTHD